MSSDPGRPVTTLNFYRTRWGSHDEFVELFRRSHWPASASRDAIETATPDPAPRRPLP